jgi:Asp-tRNA(Asn)/Glu-tRNA(Gln) amidotransferase A subunit family amidase
LPLGVQLVGRRGNDARLLRTAHWLVDTLNKGEGADAAMSERSNRKVKNSW